METLRDRMEADLKIGCYSPSTRKIGARSPTQEDGASKAALDAHGWPLGRPPRPHDGEPTGTLTDDSAEGQHPSGEAA